MNYSIFEPYDDSADDPADDIIKGLFNEINYCITKFGTISLRRMLNTVIYDHDELEQRQQLIKDICVAPHKVSRVRNLLRKIKRNQDLIYQWLEYSFDYDLFSSYDALNTSYYLDAINKTKYMSIIITIIIYIIIYFYGVYMGVTTSFIDYLREIYNGYVIWFNWFISFVTSTDSIIYYASHLLSVMYVIYSIVNMYHLSNSCISHYGRCNEFISRFGLIASLIDNCKLIAELEIIDGGHIMSTLDEIQKRFQPQFMLGDYLMVQYKRGEYKGALNDIIGYVGQVDALISVTHLLTKHYSIPFFIQAEAPMLYVSEMWNPLIEYEANVKNDFSPLEKHLTLITGPNKAGKSTYMRSIYEAVYLAQTIGVTPCSMLIMTPYRYLFTYLNVPDIIGRESLFEAELNRIYDYYTFVKSLNGGEFALSIIDELFTGTNPTEGSATSAAFCKFLSNNKNSTNIVSTHFNHSQISSGDINYCKFNAVYDADENRYKFNYLVSHGISDQHIAVELLKEKGYDKQIIEDALKFIG